MSYLNMPSTIKIRNANRELCDALSGPCLCGAWHDPEEISYKLSKTNTPYTAQQLIEMSNKESIERYN